MNFGVGENGLHPEYHAILDYLAERGIVTSITSNGLSTEVLSDEQLVRFHSVEFSLDFPDEAEHDAFRGAGNWRTVMNSLERSTRLGLPVTVTSVMMGINYDRLVPLAKVAAAFGANLRVNVYQPSKTDRFSLSYAQFWSGFRRLSESTRLVATTEPVLAAVVGIEGFAGPGCGRSTVRVAPDGKILPCTYWTESQLGLSDLERLGEGIIETEEFQQARAPSIACQDCPCRGGCAGRRALVGGLEMPDPYCPFVRGDRISLAWEKAAAADLPKAGSSCTTIVSARS
jgi:radical SAM protein with 4Fe4S-binding SPASM domain